MTDAHRKYLVIETLVGVVVNAAISALFVVLAFGGRSEVDLWGPGNLAFDMLPQTFAIAFMSVLIPTALTRKRLRSGKIAPAEGASTRLPRNLWLRSLLLAVAATVVIAGAAVLILSAVWKGPMAYGDVFLFKVLYGGLVSLLVSPIALVAALADRPAVTQP